MTSKKMSETKANRGGGGAATEGEEAPVVESFGFTETQGLDAFETFEEMNIPVAMLEGIFNYGWEKPSPIQQKSIVPLMQGKDVIAQAQSGTGKTGAFSIGSISSANEE